MQATVIPIAALAIAATALFIAMQRRLGKLQPNIVWVQLTFSEARFRAVIERWGPEGRERFRSHFPLDYCFLLCYGWLGFLLGQALRSAAIGQALCWVLPLAAACDALENLLHQRFLAAAPGSLPRQAFVLAGLASSAKWLLILAYPLLAFRA